MNSSFLEVAEMKYRLSWHWNGNLGSKEFEKESDAETIAMHEALVKENIAKKLDISDIALRRIDQEEKSTFLAKNGSLDR